MSETIVPFDHHTWVGECVEGETMVGQFDHNTSIFLEASLTHVMLSAKWTNSQCISIYVEWVTINWQDSKRKYT
jgi:hypothetical protein